MKNDSSKHHISSLDKRFDSDKNEKLEGSEAFFRNWYLDEEIIRQRKNSKENNSCGSTGLWEKLQETKLPENFEDLPSNSETFLIFLIILLWIASFVFTIYLWAKTDYGFTGGLVLMVSSFGGGYILYRLTDGKKKK